MPIKTMNNNGLQVLEEVAGEYKILIDKDAVFTTVQKYVPGSYQTFMERKADVDNSRSLLKGYNIEWSQQDDSDLFIQCNNEALQKLESQAMMLPVDGEEVQPVVLEPKTVPTTYECCFRVDKNSGEIYIGEGYEVLKYNRSDENGMVHFTETTVLGLFGAHMGFKNGNEYTLCVDVFKETDYATSPNWVKTGTLKYITKVCDDIWAWFHQIDFNSTNNGVDYRVYGTKTSTPKPFVKSVMPSGKLDRISNANETTHTFLNKGDGVVTFGNGYFSLKGDKIDKLLVYKGILTEEQKQIELNKTFKVR